MTKRVASFLPFQQVCIGLNSHTFSSQNLQQITKLFAVKANAEVYNVCSDSHDHKILENYFFDDGIMSRSALELNENQWSQRLVHSLTKCDFEYLQGWELAFCGAKIDPSDFDDLQKSISNIRMSDATKSYLFHGAPDIVARKESSFSVITTEGSGDLEFTVPRVIENSGQVLKPISISHI